MSSLLVTASLKATGLYRFYLQLIADFWGRIFVRPMDRVASVAALFVTFGLVAAYTSPPTYARSQIDGLYVIPQEVRGYQNDRLELALREGANYHERVVRVACVRRPTQPGDHQRVNAENKMMPTRTRAMRRY